MEKSVSSLKILNIVLCVILLIAFVIGTRSVNAKEITGNNDEVLPSIQYKLGFQYPPLLKNEKSNKIKEQNIIKNVDYYINQNIETLKFFSNIFGYNINDIINSIKTKEKTYHTFIINNVGYLKDKNNNLIEFNNFEEGLIEYLFSLTKGNELKRDEKYIPYQGNSKYIEDLITYYSNIYINVDKKILLSIGAAESGYYKVKFMLKYNNIYGGMSKKGLIKYNNIELGVLTYVRMMSKYYYAKGLNTIYKIGKVYCPVIENGQKKASSHWITLVNKAQIKYKNYDYNITINDINKLETI